jgi:hypothetical protein
MSINSTATRTITYIPRIACGGEDVSPQKKSRRFPTTAPSFDQHSIIVNRPQPSAFPESQILPHTTHSAIPRGSHGLNRLVVQALRPSRRSTAAEPGCRKKYAPLNCLPPDNGMQAYRARTGFRTSSASLVAHNFTMPALSPTMTEGNIASWKVKEGVSGCRASEFIPIVEADLLSRRLLFRWRCTAGSGDR